MTRRRELRIPLLAVAAMLLLTASPRDAAAQETRLRTGRTVAGTLAANDTARYTVEIGDDYFIYGEVDQISVDVAIRAVDADGTQIARTNAIGRGGERFTGVVDRGGVYTLEVFPVDGESGDYTITIHRLEPVATDPKKLADQVMARYDGDDSPGAAVEVWRDGRVLFAKTYGMANLAYGIPFETGTRTNIGSTSKQFTAFAIMLQAERGALSLDDDIRKHIPELPEFDQTVTIRHIITHTSGLREFLNLLAMTGRRLDHGDWVDRSELVDIVRRQPMLQNEPGSLFNYNNTAFALAALIVERTSGQDFDVFMRENVFEPLGMTHTMVRMDPERIVPGRSVGYTPGKYGFRQTRDLGGAVGAGGIYTTIDDLRKWVQNFANPRVGSREIFDRMMTRNVLTDGDTTGYGFGLFIDEQRGLRRIQHGGADAAHRSMLAYYPEINAGITVQSNHAGFDSSVAFRLAAAFFGDAMEPEEAVADAAQPAGAFDPDAYDPEDFDDFVGRYALDPQPDFIVSFTRQGDTLYTQATGQQRLRILPTSDSTFSLVDVQASVMFHRNEAGVVTGLTLTQNGQVHATRIADEDRTPPTAWAPSTEDLAEFAGRYFSDEIETFYTITLDDDTLVMHERRLGDANLTAGSDPDTFTGSNLNFAFERDRNGEIIGFYLSNGRTRNVRFGRVR